MIRRQPDPRQKGTCELCGGHGRELRVLAMADFIGWVCGECMRQMNESMLRRYCATAEESEPTE